ncbi:MAG: ParB/RepB/Spo0J family partition protein [Oscillospiraceae bacterium]|nr:ParB/RepB/Spo0J family partition protein [Oscillospiraceae bacterium]MBR2929004.1 ParB/RepB/Spo0J family partition protein [Oscillospiraceae bacterium]
MANQAKGLGRGLGALLGDAALESSVAEQTHTLPLSQIETCASQPRKRFDEEALADLADSIREHGIIQPITVRKLASGYYQIIAGERRWRAARMAGLSEVPVVIIEADDRKAMELAMIENLQREDLNPMEEAEGYHALMESYNLTQEEAAERVGKSRSAVANVMRLLHLCAPVRKLVEEGQLSAGHARTLIPLSPDMQEKLAETIIKNDLSVRQTEALVKKFGKEPKKAPSPEEMLSVNYTEAAAHELTEHLGRSCRIVSGKKKGRLEIEYYGVDDLNDLLDALHTLRRKSGGKA